MSITKIEITEYLAASMDGIDLEAEHGTDAWDIEAAGAMDTYCEKLRAALTTEFPGAELEVDWKVGMGPGHADISAADDQGRQTALHQRYDDSGGLAWVGIQCCREEAWEAVW